ncbi:MAG: hypothetical protein BVN35_11015 [Proteobacteria bacterium ST_bin11]|nr:MAG: hypothetical protein BVN35_11015 [Proteobacteria bacterium ST_bin11]
MDWAKKSFEEIGSIGRGKSRHRPRNDSVLYGGKYPFIQTGDIQSADFKITQFNQTYSDFGLAQSKLWPAGTLCISIVGANTAESAILGFDSCFPDSVIGFNAYEGELDNYFLKYYLELLKVQLKNISEGAARENLSLEKLLTFKIPWPPTSERKKITRILSAYDDLIENNLKRITLLEEMAQITYEEWFVRLKFPGHETTSLDSITGLPVGWESIKIGSLIGHDIGGGWGEEEKDNEFSESAFVIRGTDFDNLPTGNIENVPFRFHKKSNLASRKLEDGDIIFEVSGGSQNEGVAKSVIITNELLAKFNANVMCASFCKLARPTRKENSYLLFHFLRFLRATKGTEVFEIRSASNIVNYNWTAFLKFQLIKLPSQEVLTKFNFFAEVIHKQIYQLGTQNQLLKEARDILLPRLMTGMIDVDTVGADLSA